MKTIAAVGTINSSHGLVNNQALRRHIETLAASRHQVEEVGDVIKKEFLLPTNRGRSFAAKALNLLLPKAVQNMLPLGMAKFIAEEYDVLERIEGLLRSNIITIQEALRELAANAVEKREDLNRLTEDIKTAVREDWNAQALQQYMASKAEIEIYDVISRLLDSEFNALSPEEREERKRGLLEQLRANLEIGGALMETLGRVCSAGLRVFHGAVGQYYDFTRVYKTIAVIRDAAKEMVATNHSTFAAKGAIVETLKASLQAIELAVETAKMADQYAIASAEMEGFFESGRKRLEEKLKQLEGGRSFGTKLVGTA